MAVIHWTEVQAYVIVAITGFGPSGHDPTQLPNINLSDLDGPTTENIKDHGKFKWERWNYGIPKHEIANDGVPQLMDWFQRQYPRARALKVQAKGYGGFVLNLTWMIDDANHGYKRLFNFHVKINAGSMDLKTLFASGAQGQQKDAAMDAMFPALGSK